MAGNSCFMSTASENSMLMNAEREREREMKVPQRETRQRQTPAVTAVQREITQL